MTEIQSAKRDEANLTSVKESQSTNFDNIEWLLFKSIDSEAIQELVQKAKAFDDAENGMLSEIDINILESHGLKIIE